MLLHKHVSIDKVGRRVHHVCQLLIVEHLVLGHGLSLRREKEIVFQVVNSLLHLIVAALSQVLL